MTKPLYTNKPIIHTTPSGRPYQTIAVTQQTDTMKWINRQPKHHSTITVLMLDGDKERYRWHYDYNDNFIGYDQDYPVWKSEGWEELENYNLKE